ncbi:MAG: hypothetical protein KC684_00840 [Candidatus Omnitrophica bacterium]|nr:hypothetical protein [Candidatus Omnitrophota bacterium]
MALSDNQVIETKVPDASLKLKVVDGLIRIYRKALLNYEAGNIGYVKLGSDTLSEEFAGISLEEKNLAAADNTSNGTYDVEVLPKGCGKLIKLAVTSTITIANEGDTVYVDGDDAVDIASGITNTTNGRVGTIKQFISANEAWVKLD